MITATTHDKEKRMDNLYLADNRVLSEAETRNIRSFINEMGHIIDNRKELVEKYNIDKRFAFPDGPGWTLNKPTLPKLWERISNANANLNHLRLYTHGISIWDLKYMQRVNNENLNAPVTENFDKEMADRLSVYQDFVYQWAADSRCIPDHFLVRAPFVMGEIGHLINGILVNPDISDCQERINLLYFSGIIDYLHEKSQRVGKINILEIGAGYGAVALALKRILPLSSYTICDLPEVLSYSHAYITAGSPDLEHRMMTPESLKKCFTPSYGFHFMPNIYFDFLKNLDAKFDLVINTLSLSEMAEYQVHHYAEGISKLIGDAGIFFEQNQDNSTLKKKYPDRTFAIDGLDLEAILPKYFSNCYDIEDQIHIPHSIRHGRPRIWSNRELSFLKACQPECVRHSEEDLLYFSCYNSLKLMEYVETFEEFHIIRCCDRYYASQGSLCKLKDFAYFDLPLLEEVKSKCLDTFHYGDNLKEIKEAISQGCS